MAFDKQEVSAKHYERTYLFLTDNNILRTTIDLLGQDKIALISIHIYELFKLKAVVSIDTLIELNIDALSRCLANADSVIILVKYRIPFTDIIKFSDEKLQLLLDRQNVYALSLLQEYANVLLNAELSILACCLKYYEVVYFLLLDLPFATIMAIEENKFAVLSKGISLLARYRDVMKEMPFPLRINKYQFFSAVNDQEHIFIQKLIQLDTTKLQHYFCNFEAINKLMRQGIALEEALASQSQNAVVPKLK